MVLPQAHRVTPVLSPRPLRAFSVSLADCEAAYLPTQHSHVVHKQLGGTRRQRPHVRSNARKLHRRPAW